MVVDVCPLKRATTSVPDKPLCRKNAFDSSRAWPMAWLPVAAPGRQRCDRRRAWRLFRALSRLACRHACAVVPGQDPGMVLPRRLVPVPVLRGQLRADSPFEQRWQWCRVLRPCRWIPLRRGRGQSSRRCRASRSPGRVMGWIIGAITWNADTAASATEATPEHRVDRMPAPPQGAYPARSRYPPRSALRLDASARSRCRPQQLATVDEGSPSINHTTYMCTHAYKYT